MTEDQNISCSMMGEANVPVVPVVHKHIDYGCGETKAVSETRLNRLQQAESDLVYSLWEVYKISQLTTYTLYPVELGLTYKLSPLGVFFWTITAHGYDNKSASEHFVADMQDPTKTLESIKRVVDSVTDQVQPKITIAKNNWDMMIDYSHVVKVPKEYLIQPMESVSLTRLREQLGLQQSGLITSEEPVQLQVDFEAFNLWNCGAGIGIAGDEPNQVEQDKEVSAISDYDRAMKIVR